MKVLLKMTLLAAAAVVAGFALGRFTAPVPAEEPVVKSPAKEYEVPPAPPKMEKETLGLVLETPIDGARIEGGTVEVSGRAKAGPEPVLITLKSATGTVLQQTTATVDATAGEEFGRFRATLEFDPSPTEPVMVEVAREGSTDAPSIRTISFGTHDAVAMRAYFPRKGYDEGEACGVVEPLPRAASVAGGVYRAALEELLNGPTADEAANGSVTAIPKGTTLKSVAADANGTVSVDLVSKGYAKLESCARDAMLAQISVTLRQFPEVRDVVVSIGGVRTDLIDLQ